MQQHVGMRYVKPAIQYTVSVIHEKVISKCTALFHARLSKVKAFEGFTRRECVLVNSYSNAPFYTKYRFHPFFGVFYKSLSDLSAHAN